MLSTNVEDLYHLRLQIRALERHVAALKRLAERLSSTVPESPDQSYESHFPLETLYHLTPAAYYAALPADQDYLPEQYAQDGFIHCTRGADLLALVANRHYRAIPGDFLMLAIDVPLLAAPLKYEALDSAMPHPFPHIYGPLNRDAIIEVVKMRRGADGTFLVPPFKEQS